MLGKISSLTIVALSLTGCGGGGGGSSTTPVQGGGEPTSKEVEKSFQIQVTATGIETVSSGSPLDIDMASLQSSGTLTVVE